MAKEKAIFECFASPLYKGGNKQLIGISEAEQLRKAALMRGFTTKAGCIRKKLSPLDFLVIAMRDATSAEEFDHEWWAAARQARFKVGGTLCRRQNVLGN